MKKGEFDWGDAVVIKSTAPKKFRPGCIGCICGFRSIDSIEVAIQFGQPQKTELFSIEFGNGEYIEVPAVFLEHYP